MTLHVAAPLAGRVLPLSDVPDAAFAGQMLGPGLAIEPDPGSDDAVTAVAPVAGTVVALHPHAFVVVTPDGAGVLVHLGIDTVRLHGEGYTLHVAKGDALAAGDRVVTWALGPARAHGFSTVCPVVLMETPPDATTGHATGAVGAGDPLFRRDA